MFTLNQSKLIATRPVTTTAAYLLAISSIFLPVRRIAGGRIQSFYESFTFYFYR